MNLDYFEQPSVFAFTKHFTSEGFDYERFEDFLSDPPSEIVDGLWLGNFSHAINGHSLNLYKFDYIFNIGVRYGGYEYTTPSLSISISDREDSQICQYFDTVTEMIHEKIKDGKIVYVHCHLGVSRSSTIIIAYLIRYHGMDADTAYQFVVGKRYICNPNRGFRNQLREYYKKLRDA